VVYLHEELSPDRRYRYRLRARNSAGDWSVASPATGAQPLTAGPKLTAQTAASGSVKLSWSGGSHSATLWEYRWRLQDGVWDRWTRITGSDAETTEHVVSNLSEDVRYESIIRAYNAAGAGSPSNIVSAVAGLTPTVPSDRETLYYDRHASPGDDIVAGRYTFLTKHNDLRSVATTLAQVSSAAALLLHNVGQDSQDYNSALAAVQVGDRFTWYMAVDCWVSYSVTEKLSHQSTTTLIISHVQTDAAATCGLTPEQQQDPSSFTRFRDRFAALQWNQLLPNEPEIGPDGIRILLTRVAVEGGHTYRLRVGEPTDVLIDIPVGMRLKYTGYAMAFTRSGTFLYANYIDLASGGFLGLDPVSGDDPSYFVPLAAGQLQPSPEARSRFEALIDSIRTVPLP